jgi:hypothetical protein
MKCTPQFNNETRDLMRQRDDLARIAKGAELGDFTKAMQAKAHDLIDEGLSAQDVLTKTTEYINQYAKHSKEEVLAAINYTKRAAPTKTEAQTQRAAIRAELRDLQDGPDSTYNKTRATALKKQLAELERRLRENDFSPNEKPTVRQLNEANTKAQFAVAKAKEEFGRRQFEDEMSKRTPIRKIIGGVAETANFSRAVMTSVDLSAVLRQGGILTISHPVRSATSIIPSLRAFASEEAQFEVDAEIAARPNFPIYKKHGLELTDNHTYVQSKMEEQFMSRWIDKFPKALGGGFLRGSNRAFSTFLNKLRADSFDAMAASLGRTETLTDAEGKAIANYINVATGRGHIGSKNTAAVGLNTVFFAPRLVASRFNMLFGQPLYGGTVRTRRLVATEYARFLAGSAAVYGLATLANGGNNPIVSVDPRSADFLKMRFGDTYIDPMAGLAQVTTFLTRVVTGEKKDSHGKIVPLRDTYRLTDVFPGANPRHRDGKVHFGGDTASDVIARFARTKLAPIPGAIVNLVSGEDVIGQPATPGTVVKSLVVPMSMQNVYEIMTDNGIPAGTAIEMLNLLGMGVNYRDPKKRKH